MQEDVQGTKKPNQYLLDVSMMMDDGGRWTEPVLFDEGAMWRKEAGCVVDGCLMQGNRRPSM